MKDRKEQIDENSEMLIFFSNTSSVGFISITTHSTVILTMEVKSGSEWKICLKSHLKKTQTQKPTCDYSLWQNTNNTKSEPVSFPFL